jgi:ankyrin repeat protein
MDEHHELSPTDAFMDAVCHDDPIAAVKAIDAAIAAGADIHDPYIQPLYYAAMSGSPAIVRHLIAIGCTMTSEWPARASTDPTADVDRGDCALHAAAQNGWLDVLKLLLAMPDAPRFMRAFDNDSISLSPLAWAAREGHTACVELLFRHGADPNLRDEFRIGYTALEEAMENGHVETVRYLLSIGADPDIPTWMQMTARQRAERLPHDKIAIRDLIRATPRGGKPGRFKR